MAPGGATTLKTKWFIVWFIILVLPFAAGDPEPIQVTVGVYQLPPLVMFDDTGTPSGVVIDVLNTIAREENWHIDYQACPWAECMQRIRSGSLDMLCLIADLPERRQWIEFNKESIYLDWGQIWTRPGSTIETLNDLHRKRVAGIKEEVFTTGFKRILDETTLTCQYLEVDGYRQLVDLITENAVDAVILNRMFDPGFFNADLKKTNIVFSPTPMGFGFPIGHDKNRLVIPQLDRHLRQLKNDPNSVYYKTMKKWLTSRESRSLGPSFIIYGLSLLIIVAGILLLLRRQSRDMKRQASEIEAKSRQLTDMSQRRVEAEVSYYWLFNTISVGVMMAPFNADGSPGLFSEVNKHACLIFGRDEETLKRMTLLDLAMDPEHQMIWNRVTELTSRRQAVFQIRIMRADGNERNVEIHANLIEAGDQWKILCVVRDASDRLLMENEYHSKMVTLEQQYDARNKQLHLMRREMQMVAGTISHDLQAPLKTIEETLDRIRQSCSSSDEAARKEIDRAITLLQRVGLLVKGLLEYTRLTRKDVVMEAVGLSQVCSEALLQLDTNIREHRADVVIERPMPRVIAHSHTLLRVIQNLLTNAVKFVEFGRTPRVILRSEHRGQTVRLWVIDNGIGVAPEYTERIFEVFERLHGVDEYPGHGLGLAIVKRAMEMMNGSLGVISEVGEGSRFWIELPAADPTPPQG